MMEIKHYRDFRDMARGYKSTELASLAVLGLSSLTVFDVFNLICYSDSNTTKFGLSFLALFFVGISWVALVVHLTDYDGYEFFLKLYFDYLRYKNTKTDLSTKYKYAIIDPRGGSECDCEEDVIWKEKDILVASYQKIIDLSDGHSLTLTEIKSHALPPPKTKRRRASKSKGRI